MSASTVTIEPAHRSSPPPGRLRRLVRGPAADPQWARPALFGLLALTALLYLWDLSRNGYANDFYAAAVQAGTFEALVAKGEIHYYLGENTETFGGGTGSSAITSWVAAHFTSETVGGVTVYNLTQEK